MKIAIVKLSAMGDVIHAMVALQFIKKHNPNIEIDWFVEKAFAGVLENNPHIDNIFSLNLKSIKKDKKQLINQIKIIKEYSKKRYDLIIDAQGLVKSAIVSRLLGKNVAGFSKSSIREKVASYLYKIKVNSAYDKNVITRNMDLFSNALHFKYSKQELLKKEPFLFFQNENSLIYDYISKEKRNILFIIGASWPSKMYSKEKFAKIIYSLDENCLIAWGSEEEKSLAEEIAKESNAKVLPKLDLNSLKAVVSKSDLVIGNDTGPTHMAWAMNVASITIFGCTPGYRNTYETKINKIVESNSIVDPVRLNRNDFSIKEIDEDTILEMAKELLDGKKDKGLL